MHARNKTNHMMCCTCKPMSSIQSLQAYIIHNGYKNNAEHSLKKKINNNNKE